MTNYLITSCIVLPMTAEGGGTEYFTASVGLCGGKICLVSDDKGRIESFRRSCAESGNGLTEIDGRGKLLMPGLINMHTHVAMTLMRSYADDMPLMPWLHERIWPFEARLTRDDIYVGARMGIAEMLLGGTTTFTDMYWHENAVGEAVERMGIRAVLSPCFIDSNMEAFEQDMELSVRLAASCDRLSVMVAPHAPYSCSSENIRRGIEVADRYGVGIHSHIAETKSEVESIASAAGLTPVQYVDSLGMFERPAVAAHLVYVDDRDIEILASKGVAAVHNPQSNMKLSSGIAPMWKMMQRGVNVCIGTDGASSNNDLDMWDEMRTAALLQKAAGDDPCVMPAYEVLKAATVNAAKAIGRQGELGIVAEEATADVILVDLQRPHLQPCHDIVSTLVYCGKASDVDTVFVAGRRLVAGGRLVECDQMQFVEETNRRVAEILAR